MSISIDGSTLNGCIITNPYCDPYYSYLALLLPMNGANGSTTFTDYSPSTKTVSTFGGASISTSQSKFGGSSGYFDGTTDYLSIVDDITFAVGSSNFTVEMWVYPTSITGQRNIISQSNSSYYSAFRIEMVSSNYNFLLSQTGTGWAGGSTTLTAPATINTWTHLALVRNSNTFTLYVDGVSKGTRTVSGSLWNNVDPLLIGAQYGGINGFEGYINDLRFTNGIARYTSNFTPPAQAFPTISCNESAYLYDTYIDSLNVDYRWRFNTNFYSAGTTELSVGTQPSAILTKGAASANFQTQVDPLVNNTRDSLALYQTSGGYYTAPISVDGTQGFTIGCWTQITGAGTNYELWNTNGSSAGNYSGIWLGIYSGNPYLQYGNNGGASSSDRSSWTSNAPTFVVGEKYFVVFYSGPGSTPSSIVKKLYVNGVSYTWSYSSGSATSISYISPPSFYVASRRNTNTESSRYMDDFFFKWGEMSSIEILQLYNYGKF